MRRLLLLAFIWGWSFLFIKVAVEGMTPPTVAFLRIALGALVLRVWLRVRGVPGFDDPRTRRWAGLVGVIGSALPFTMLAWGEERISSALTAVLNASTPLFTAVAAAVLVGERIRPVQVVGLFVGLGGVSVAAGFGAADLTGSSITGALASVGAGACYGVAFALMRQHLLGIPPAVAAAGQLTTGAVVLAPVALATSVSDGFELTWERAGAVVLLGVVGTGLAYLLNYRVVADLGPTRASLVTYVIPIVAVVVGVVVLDESFSSRVLGGGALTIAGIAIVNGRARLPRRPPLPSAAVAVAVLALVLAACGDDGPTATTSTATTSTATTSTATTAATTSTTTSACDPERREALDPATANHHLPGAAEEPVYLTDPPTSGPHAPGPRRSGVLDQPLTRPEQVGSLEAGGVLLQHRDLTGDELAALAALAGDGVAVAPNPDLPARVVATAWLSKQSCDAVDAVVLRGFVDAHLGQGPGSDG